MKLPLLLSFLLLAVVSHAAAPSRAEIETFLRDYCLRCHNAEKKKGDLRLDNLSADFDDLLVAQKWDEVMLRINSGEMPPKDEKQPPAEAVSKVADWITTRLAAGRAARLSQRTPVTLFRLSREEYANTIYDLLGVRFDPDAPGALTEDPRWHGFERIGSLLTLAPSHVERYFEAAQKVIAEAFPEKESQTLKGRFEADSARAKQKQKDVESARPVRDLVLPGHTARGTIDARAPGLYRIRVRLSAVPSSRGRVPHLVIWDTTMKRSLHSVDVLADEETHLPAGRYGLLNQAPGLFEARALSLTQQTPFTHSRERKNVHSGSYKIWDESGAAILPLFMVDSCEWEGPIILEADRKKREGLLPENNEPAAVRASLRRFLDRAWRRPARDAELTAFEQLIAREMKAGEKFRPAYLSALVAALTSKNFYYLHEGTAGQDRKTVNDWELASRLSYFLWSSMPDEALLAAARAGTLSQPAELRAQVSRMLANPKVSAFLNAFPQQWLQLHKVGAFPPDVELYPAYDKWLEDSMVLESKRYFAEVFARNLSLREFLQSDWTMLNPRLALHYGLPAGKGTDFQRVTLRPEDRRGGLLTHAAVLSLTSDGVRHRPVHRGVWVWETIFGKSPPPPPPNVEPLEPTPANSPKATIRVQLEAHATHATCAACHRKIDPLGFAFDNYDAIGRWRTHEVVTTGQGDNPPVNASGTLPTGAAFAGPDEFKRLLATDLPRFAEAFTGQLATYGLRRMMTLDDEAELRVIAAATKPNGYPLRELVEQLALSEFFRRR
jgi:Protein of unknown function (DUF1592)/Protein of unknown function (DUF1588)/Protein of unknown function (DUF1587)/Protein of unknown function (DUF1585)/Protein of unknown function (DUF1595)/Planctomycete cytochrome C